MILLGPWLIQVGVGVAVENGVIDGLNAWVAVGVSGNGDGPTGRSGPLVGVVVGSSSAGGLGWRGSALPAPAGRGAMAAHALSSTRVSTERRTRDFIFLAAFVISRSPGSCNDRA